MRLAWFAGMAKPMPTLVEGRAARVAAVDRGVDLQEVVVAAGADHAPVGRDDAGGHGAAQAERIADRDHRIADPHLGRIGEFHIGQRLVGVDLQHGEVGVRIRADDLRLELAAVVQRDRHLVGVGDDVVVGGDVAMVVEDEAGAGAHHRHLRTTRHPELLRAALEEALHEALEHLALGTFAEEPPELLGVARELLRAADQVLTDAALGGHADHGRHHLLDQIRIARPHGRVARRRHRPGRDRRILGLDRGHTDGKRADRRGRQGDRRQSQGPPVGPNRRLGGWIGHGTRLLVVSGVHQDGQPGIRRWWRGMRCRRAR
ncbi:MAG: hypothetical protein K0R41_3178 [Geminicoccaceae bacterium]|nr:hypothetical protein [Geminicoccaceae bacterium]